MHTDVRTSPYSPPIMYQRLGHSYALSLVTKIVSDFMAVCCAAKSAAASAQYMIVCTVAHCQRAWSKDGCELAVYTTVSGNMSFPERCKIM
eukprot:1997481-Amphidinium_carterae.1